MLFAGGRSVARDRGAEIFWSVKRKPILCVYSGGNKRKYRSVIIALSAQPPGVIINCMLLFGGAIWSQLALEAAAVIRPTFPGPQRSQGRRGLENVGLTPAAALRASSLRPPWA